MTGATRLADLNGARGMGISLGSINVDVNGTDLTVDLTTAHSVADVITTLETEIQTVDAGATVQIDPLTNNRLEIIPSLGFTVTVADLVGPATAADLGIDGVYTGPAGGTGRDLAPKLTELTPVANLTGVTVPMGTIRLESGGQVRDLDLSGAATVRDIMLAVKALDIGVRVEIADTGDRLDFVNELSGSPMSIGEVAGGTTATELGVRSYAGWTLLADFNRGRGVDIVSGNVDPVSGLPDPARDMDFRVTLKGGQTFDVDLAGAETVADVITIMEAAAVTGGVAVPIDFNVSLAADGNGLVIADGTVGLGNLSITALNGSFAAEDLGILGSTTGATLTSEDRATVYVESVFTHLMDLHAALLADDERGITFAGERFETDIARLAKARADVGLRGRAVSDAIEREGNLLIQDANLKSQVQDLDYTEASIRFASLQQQLQAGLLTASQVTQFSLLDFLS
jgi:flagellin-like hook-associated protein FlgL